MAYQGEDEEWNDALEEKTHHWDSNDQDLQGFEDLPGECQDGTLTEKEWLRNNADEGQG